MRTSAPLVPKGVPWRIYGSERKILGGWDAVDFMVIFYGDIIYTYTYTYTYICIYIYIVDTQLAFMGCHVRSQQVGK